MIFWIIIFEICSALDFGLYKSYIFICQNEFKGARVVVLPAQSGDFIFFKTNPDVSL